MALKELLQFLVRRLIFINSVAVEYPVCIGINNENRSPEGIEEDAVGCLRTNSLNGKELFP